MLDHPRPTKAVLSFVNIDAGILSGMLAVAKLLASFWSMGLARTLSLKNLLASGSECALRMSTVSSHASILTSALMVTGSMIGVVKTGYPCTTLICPPKVCLNVFMASTRSSA